MAPHQKPSETVKHRESSPPQSCQEVRPPLGTVDEGQAGRWGLRTQRDESPQGEAGTVTRQSWQGGVLSRKTMVVPLGRLWLCDMCVHGILSLRVLASTDRVCTPTGRMGEELASDARAPRLPCAPRIQWRTSSWPRGRTGRPAGPATASLTPAGAGALWAGGVGDRVPSHSAPGERQHRPL